MHMPGEKHNMSKGYRAFVVSSKTAIVALVFVLFIVVVIFLARKTYSLGYEVGSYTPSKENAQDVGVLIKSDMTVRELGEMLIENGVIDESIEAFLIQERLSDYHNKYIPGLYTLNTSMTVEEILETISTPKEQEE